MTFRVLILVPEGLTFEALTPEQQVAVNSVLGQYVLPMPSTIAADGQIVLDGVAADNFDPATIAPLGLPFEIIGIWRDDGHVVMPLNEGIFLRHLPELEQGIKILHEPHRWAGWPELF